MLVKVIKKVSDKTYKNKEQKNKTSFCRLKTYSSSKRSCSRPQKQAGKDAYPHSPNSQNMPPAPQKGEEEHTDQQKRLRRQFKDFPCLTFPAMPIPT